MPESVAAQAILLQAYLDVGHPDRYYSGLSTVRKMTPVTAEDHLFLAQVFSSIHRDKSLVLLDRALELRDNSMTRLIRAEVLTAVAEDTGRPADGERAVKEAGVAQVMLPKHPWPRP